MAELDPKYNLLARWHTALGLAVVAKEIIENEQTLRKEVAAAFFPEPAEGVNAFDLEGGWKLKLSHKIERKVDEPMLDSTRAQLREININPDLLVTMKPTLDLKAYRALVLTNPEAAKVFEQALTIKPASPTLELVQPKE